MAALGGRLPVTAPLAALRGATAPRGGGGTAGVCGSVGGSAGVAGFPPAERPSAPCRTTARGGSASSTTPHARTAHRECRPTGGNPAPAPRLARGARTRRRANAAPAAAGAGTSGDEHQDHEPSCKRCHAVPPHGPDAEVPEVRRRRPRPGRRRRPPPYTSGTFDRRPNRTTHRTNPAHLCITTRWPTDRSTNPATEHTQAFPTSRHRTRSRRPHLMHSSKINTGTPLAFRARAV